MCGKRGDACDMPERSSDWAMQGCLRANPTLRLAKRPCVAIGEMRAPCLRS
jgi:hypothetical protein